jgi:hypothetical protein
MGRLLFDKKPGQQERLHLQRPVGTFLTFLIFIQHLPFFMKELIRLSFIGLFVFLYHICPENINKLFFAPLCQRARRIFGCVVKIP